MLKRGRPKSENPRNKILKIRVSERELDFLKDRALVHGFKSVSEYIRFVTMYTS